MHTTEEQVRAFVEHVVGWTPEQRARVEAARPDTTRPAPGRKRGTGGPAGLAERLVDGNALATASTTLPLGPTQVLVAVLLVGASTRERLADLLGRNHYQLLESALFDRAKRTPANPRLSTLVALADVYGTTVPELVAQIFAAAPPRDGDSPHPPRGT